MNNRGKTKKHARALEKLEKDLNSLKLTIEKIDKQIFQFNKISKAIKIVYQKLFNEMKSLQKEIRN